MEREYWLDGFNFFHHWDSTKGLMRSDSGVDIVKAVERSVRILGRHLGSKCRHVVVYLDGGLARTETRLGPLRIRHCGPGGKADDRMLGDLGNLGDGARLVTAVSNDRELKANLRAYGAQCLGVGEYLALVEGKGGSKRQPGKGGGKTRQPPGGKRLDDEIMREKCRTLSPYEVNAWLEFFGGDAEG